MNLTSTVRIVRVTGKRLEAKGKGTRRKPSPTTNETAPTSAAAETTTQPITSLDMFELCIERARNLIKLHKAAHGKAGKPEKYTSDAHRAAIVLAVSALDAFIRDFAISRTRALLTSRNTALPSALTAHVKKFLKDDDLLEAARKDDLLDRVEKAFRNDFDRRSFQGTRNIEDQLAIVGYDNVFHTIAINAGVNEDTLREQLDRFTQRRHAIAHRGDYDLSENPPKENVVTKKDAEDCIKLVSLIAKEMASLGESP